MRMSGGGNLMKTSEKGHWRPPLQYGGQGVFIDYGGTIVVGTETPPGVLR